MIVSSFLFCPFFGTIMRDRTIQFALLWAKLKARRLFQTLVCIQQYFRRFRFFHGVSQCCLFMLGLPPSFFLFGESPQVLIGGTPYKVGDTVTFPVGNTSVVYVITDANGAKSNDTTTIQVLPPTTYDCRSHFPSACSHSCGANGHSRWAAALFRIRGTCHASARQAFG